MSSKPKKRVSPSPPPAPSTAAAGSTSTNQQPQRQKAGNTSGRIPIPTNNPAQRSFAVPNYADRVPPFYTAQKSLANKVSTNRNELRLLQDELQRGASIVNAAPQLKKFASNSSVRSRSTGSKSKLFIAPSTTTSLEPDPKKMSEGTALRKWLGKLRLVDIGTQAGEDLANFLSNPSKEIGLEVHKEDLVAAAANLLLNKPFTAEPVKPSSATATAIAEPVKKISSSAADSGNKRPTTTTSIPIPVSRDAHTHVFLKHPKLNPSISFSSSAHVLHQTVTISGHIFRTRYATAPLNPSKIRTVLSASQDTKEKEDRFSSPYPNKTVISDTILWSSSQALMRLNSAQKSSTGVPTQLGKILLKFVKSEDKEVLRGLNVLSGILFQVSGDLRRAAHELGAAIKSVEKEVLKHESTLTVGSESSTTTPPPPVEVNIQIPTTRLSRGLTALKDSARLGAVSLESLRFGVRLRKDHRKVLERYIESAKILGCSDCSSDFGALLVNVLAGFCQVGSCPETPGVLSHLGQSLEDIESLSEKVEEKSQEIAKRSYFRLRVLASKDKNKKGTSSLNGMQ